MVAVVCGCGDRHALHRIVGGMAGYNLLAESSGLVLGERVDAVCETALALVGLLFQLAGTRMGLGMTTLPVG